MICSKLLGDASPRLEGEVEDKDGFCKACGNIRIKFELAIKGKLVTDSWSIAEPTRGGVRIAFWMFDFLGDPPSHEETRNGS